MHFLFQILIFFLLKSCFQLLFQYYLENMQIALKIIIKVNYKIITTAKNKHKQSNYFF